MATKFTFYTPMMEGRFKMFKTKAKNTLKCTLCGEMISETEYYYQDYLFPDYHEYAKCVENDEIVPSHELPNWEGGFVR